MKKNDMQSSVERNLITALIKQGNILKREGKLEEGAAVYRRCIEVNPTSAWSYHNLGEVLGKLGKLDEAIVAYRQAIKLNPNSAWSYHNLAVVLVKKGSPSEAITYSHRACELNPDYYEFYKVLAWCLKKEKKWEAAIAAYLKVIELNPTDSEAYYWLGDIYRIQRKWQKGIEIYQQGVEKARDNEALILKVKQLTKDQQNAQKQKEIQTHIYDYRSIAIGQKETGNLEEAIATYRKAINLQPNYLDYWQLGILLVETQQWEESILCYEKLLELQPWQQGQIKQCLSLGELLVNNNKLSQEQHYLKLGNALQKQGKLTEAINWYNQALQLNSSLKDDLDIVFMKKYESNGKSSQLNFQALNNKIGFLEIYPGSQINLKKPITLDSKICPGFLQEKKHRGASLVVVPEGRVWFNNPRSLAVISWDNQFVIKEIYDDGQNFSVASINSENILEIDGTVAFLSGQWGDINYFHWMFDVIAKIHLLEKAGIKLGEIDKFVVNSYQQQFQKDTLNYLGITPDKIVESNLNPWVKAKSLIVPLSEMMQSWSCEFLQTKLLPEQQGEKIEDWERIYISRKDTSHRRVTNEKEVCEFLKKFGFRSVNLGSMPVVKQALLFANAKVVVGPHGAGFTNLVFCNSGTKVVELHTPISVRPWYHLISDRCGLEYYYLIGEDIGMGNSDFTIDLDSLSQLINILQI